ncbi:hypothetical protein YC2023_005397 [Brassica napus]
MEVEHLLVELVENRNQIYDDDGMTENHDDHYTSIIDGFLITKTLTFLQKTLTDRERDDERQARGRRERSTSPLDRSHKSRPSQDRATTASRNDEVSGLYFCLLEMIM